MSNVTLKKSVAVKMIAAGMDLDESFGEGNWSIEGEETAPAKTVTAKREMPAEVKAARKHNYERRMVRREKTTLGGLTRGERQALYAEHPELSTMSATARAKAWKRIVAEYKAA